MHQHLERAAAALSVDLPSLAAAHEFSERQIREARLSFRKRLGDNHGLDIVVCGSMARREMSRSSDFDYLIVAHGLVEDASRLRSFRAACDEWCIARGIKPPGSTGIFGKVVSGAELVEQIGLERGTGGRLRSTIRRRSGET
jgi:predicted nucleotidyltransferase